MKQVSIILFFLAINFFNANAQVPTYLWAKGSGNSLDEHSNAVATDALGNSYTVGDFGSASINFGTITLTNSSSLKQDVFIVKYDPNGNVLWAKSAGGVDMEQTYSVSTDPNGNVIVTGFFSSPSITFGAITLTNTGAAPFADIFIVKYDPNGNVLWAKSAGGTLSDRAWSVSTDSNGNIFITGDYHSSTIAFGTTILSKTGQDIFIAKYDPNGNVLWAKSAGGYGTGTYLSNSISTDSLGNAIITGQFYNSPINFGTTSLSNSGLYDIFIAKYDSNGNVLWAKSAGGSDDEMGKSITVDLAGNIIIAGKFSSSSIAFGSSILTNLGIADIFIAKYDSSGNPIWAKSVGGVKEDNALCVTVDTSANVYTTGYFDSPSITFGSSTFTNAGSADIFIAKYDSSGNILWAKSVGGSSTEVGQGISVDVNRNIVVAGYSASPVLSFGSLMFVNSTSGTTDNFITKLSTANSIENIQKELSFTIMPNPFANQATIKFDFEQKNTTIRILDLLGRVVNEYIVTGKDFLLGKGIMNKGLYYLQVINVSNASCFAKILVE